MRRSALEVPDGGDEIGAVVKAFGPLAVVARRIIFERRAFGLDDAFFVPHQGFVGMCTRRGLQRYDVNAHLHMWCYRGREGERGGMSRCSI